MRITGVPLGSGVPVAGGMPAASRAVHIDEGDFHAPNYLPGYPTAATLWPRVVHVPCQRDEANGELICAGYGVSPLRGEYIYLRPFIEPKPQPPAPPAEPPAQKKPLE